MNLQDFTSTPPASALIVWVVFSVMVVKAAMTLANVLANAASRVAGLIYRFELKKRAALATKNGGAV